MRIKRVLAAALVLTLSFELVADEKNDVDPEALKRVDRDIKYLASDSLEGRGVQTKGIEVAADYVREEFRKAGLKGGAEDGSFFQYFNVPIREKADESGTTLKLTAGDEQPQPLTLAKDFQPQQAGGPGKAKGEIVFVGYGISAPDLGYDDYANVDVQGKVVLMIRREPQQNDEDSKFDGKEASQHSFIATKLSTAKKAGAAGVLFVNDGLSAPSADKDALSPPNAFGAARASQRVPFVHITREQGNRLLAKAPLEVGDKQLRTLAEAEAHIDETLQPISQPLRGCSAEYAADFRTKTVKAWNVIGVVEGEGPLADETVIIGAHYDHLGFGGYGSRKRGSSEVHNGADDNATGTAAVLELARRFAKKKPARRMVFIAFSGEERGLVGSRYYVENPTVPLKDIVVMLNFDMIGNLRSNRATLGGAGSGTGLEAVARAAADAVPVDVTIRAATSGGSDHLPFLGKRVPIMFCNTGLTDLYHTPEDDYETLNIPGAVKVVDFCEKLLAGVVGMEERPVFSMAPRPTRGRVRTYLGVQPAAGSSDDETSGIRVRAVTAGSPAAKAGLKVGDVVRKVGDKEMKEIRDIFTVLIGKNPGDKVKVIVERDGETVEMEVELASPPSRRPRNNN